MAYKINEDLYVGNQGIQLKQIKTNKTNIDGKAPTSHASTGTTYGVGTSSNYGHCKTINNLTTSSHVDGNALSAYQGYLLEQNKQAKPINLYNNTSGSQSVTLNQNSANFSFIDITYKQQGNSDYCVQRVYSPNGKKVNLTASKGNGSAITLYSGTITISGALITTNNGSSMAFNSNGSLAGFAGGSELKIYRVDGWI